MSWFKTVLAIAITAPRIVLASTAVPVLSAGAPLEGLAFAKNGDMYLTVNETGEILRYDLDHQTLKTIATLGSGLALGLVVSPRGELYAALASFDPSTNGVYRVDEASHTVQRVADVGLAPNGMVFDEVGNLYITESIFGLVYRLDRQGHLEVWSADPLLAGNNPNLPIGANGITYRHATIYVMNFDLGAIISIPILKNGNAGAGSVYVRDDSMVAGDGITMDVRGNIYVAGNHTNNVLRVRPDRTVEELATGLDEPTSPAFGISHGDRTTLYVAGFGETTGIEVFKVEVGIPGLPPF